MSSPINVSTSVTVMFLPLFLICFLIMFFFLGLDCDFEESHLCGYSNQWNANVNWFVGGGGSQLLSNDMLDDHTYNNKTGE